MNQLARPTDISRSCSGCVKMIRALSNSNFKFQNFKFQISKLHIPSFHMNQLACPTDIPSGADGCAKMHLEKGDSGARSKMGGAKGVKGIRKFLSMYVSSIDNMRQGKDELGTSSISSWL